MIVASQTHTVVVIDSALKDYQSLASGVIADATAVVLDPNRDGVEQICEVLVKFPGVNQLHIVSHGRPGMLQLGSTKLNLATLNNYRTQLQRWQNYLGKRAEILLYGCNVAAGGATSREFLQQLHHLTGANIAASQTPTGNAALGGNWQLEFRLGTITAKLPFRHTTLQAYPEILMATFVDETFTGDTVLGSWLFGTSNGTSANPALTAGNPTSTAPFTNLDGLNTDTNGQGVLRLTNNDPNQATFALYNDNFVSGAGLTVTFDLFSYTNNPLLGSPSPGDGLSFFLIDGNAAPTTAGAEGGSLGYAQTTAEAGVVGGYLGIGFDEFGDFSNPTDGRVGGAGNKADSVVVRGRESLNYRYLTAITPSETNPAWSLNNLISDLLSLLLLNPNEPNESTRSSKQQSVQVQLTADNQLSVAIDFNQDGSFADEVLIQSFDLNTDNGTIPETFKFGFAASTVNGESFHELRNVKVESIDPVVDLVTNVTGTTDTFVGETINYSIATSNNGPDDATNVNISDQLIAGLNNVVVSDGGSYDPQTGVVTWPTIASLANGTNVQRTISFTAPDITSLTSSADSNSNTVFDTEISNNAANLITNIAPRVDLAVSQTVDNPNPNPGDTIVYTITLTNNGPSTATGVVLDDDLPAGLTYISDNSGGLYDSNTGNWNVESLGNGQVATLEITAQVDAASEGSNVTNSVQVVGVTEDEPNTTNNQSQVDISVNNILPVITVNSLTTNDNTPQLTGTVDDSTATISVTLNSQAYTATNNGDGTWVLADNTVAPLADGTYDVVVTATDPVGNIGSDNSIDELNIDATLPIVTVNSATTSDTTPELTGSVDDATATISVTVNGVGYAATNNGDGTWELADNTVAPLTDGTYDVAVTATDSVGNVGSDNSIDELNIDATLPIVTVNILTTSDTTPQLTGTVDDATATISVTANGQVYAATNNGDGTWVLADDTVNLLTEGTYDVTVTATDPVGNVGSDNSIDELNIDSTLPTVTVNPVTTSDTTPQLTGTVDDATANISVTVNGVGYAATNNGDGTWVLADNTVAPLAEGIYEVNVTATDPVGNVGNDDTTWELIIQAAPIPPTAPPEATDPTTNPTTNPTPTTDPTDPTTPGNISLLQPVGSTDVMESGGMDVYKVKLTSQPTGDVEVAIATDGQTTLQSPDGSQGTSVTLLFTPDNWNLAQTVGVSAVNDDVLEGLHTSQITHTATSLDPEYDNLTVNLTANISDNDDVGIWLQQNLPHPEMAGTEKDDTIIGGSEDNILHGLNGNDYLDGQGGHDILYGAEGSDYILGGSEADRIYGSDGKDYLNGDDDDDLIYGGDGSDRLYGNNGRDRLLGDDGNDHLWGDAGVDTLTGGQGNDAFAIGLGTGGMTLENADLILDFNPDEDLLDLIGSDIPGQLTPESLNLIPGSGNFAGETIVQHWDTGEFLVRLLGVDASQINLSHFI